MKQISLATFIDLQSGNAENSAGSNYFVASRNVNRSAIGVSGNT
jgi:hypothetical protein